jgi:hypothetical protein
MKHYLKIVTSLLVFATFISCQDEENTTTPTTPTTLTSASELTHLLARVTVNETSIDNVIDSTSCFSIQLPVQVNVNGQLVDVQTPADYATVPTYFTATDNNISFVYPITVLDANYNASTVATEADFNALLATCNPPAVSPVIGCITLNYPISVSTYASATQTPSTQTFDSNNEFFLYLLSLQPGDYYEINFPVTAQDPAGQTITIADNAAFQTAIQNAQQACCGNPHVLTDDLIIYIPISNEAVDLTGFAVPTVEGSYQYVTDRGGNPNGAISMLDGGQFNRIDVPGSDANNLMQNGAFTISFWFNRQDTIMPSDQFEELMNTADLSIFLGNQNNNAIFSPFVVGVALNNPLYDLPWVNNGMTTELNVWHHLAITYDGSLLILYRDGGVVNAATTTFTNMPGADFAAYFKGYLDDIRVYKKALTQDEIHQLHDLEADVNQCL